MALETIIANIFEGHSKIVPAMSGVELLQTMKMNSPGRAEDMAGSCQITALQLCALVPSGIKK